MFICHEVMKVKQPETFFMNDLRCREPFVISLSGINIHLSREEVEKLKNRLEELLKTHP